MDARRENEPAPTKNRTTIERTSERELVVTRTINGPARIVFEAWTKPELLKRWWAPKSTGLTLLSCEADVRVGGTYRFVFGHDASESMAFFGRYVEVTPHSRLVWTSDEGAGGEAVTTATFEERGARRCWSCASSIPRRTLSTAPWPPEWSPGRARPSSNSKSLSSLSARASDGHEVVDLAAPGSLATHCVSQKLTGVETLHTGADAGQSDALRQGMQDEAPVAT